MSEGRKLSVPPLWAIALGSVAGHYGLRRALALVGKASVSKHTRRGMSKYRAVRELRRRSHPSVTNAYERVYIRSR